MKKRKDKMEIKFDGRNERGRKRDRGMKTSVKLDSVMKLEEEISF
jgi:hypothetical protein